MATYLCKLGINVQCTGIRTVQRVPEYSPTCFTRNFGSYTNYSTYRYNNSIRTCSYNQHMKLGALNY